METQFDEKQSLKLIAEMIQKTKDNLSEGRPMYLLWGYLVLAATASQYLMLFVFQLYRYNYIGWPVLMILGVIITLIINIKQGRKSKVHTQLDRFMIFFWSGFLISLLLAIFILIDKHLAIFIPIILVFYGLAIFVSGGILKFKPLIVGGISCWIIAIISIFAKYEYQLILLGLAVVIAYIIPGHMMKKQTIASLTN